MRLHSQDAERKQTSCGYGQCKRQTKRSGVGEIHRRMRLQTSLAVMAEHDTDIRQRLPETTVVDCKCQRKGPAGNCSRDNQQVQRRKAGNTADSSHQLHITSAQASSEVEDQKYPAGDEPGKPRISKASPTSGNPVEQQPHGDSRTGNAVRNAALADIVERPDARAQQRDSGKQYLVLKGNHGEHHWRAMPLKPAWRLDDVGDAVANRVERR